MQSIDLYTTSQCPFCKQLKIVLDNKGISYAVHDVASDEAAFKEMQSLTNGAMSVPVTVLNKGQKDQQVIIGYSDALGVLGIEGGEGKNVVKTTATLTCPECGYKQEGEIPTKSCVPFYVCRGCGRTIKAKGEECCVFCSYADKKCPVNAGDTGCEGGVCRI